MDWSPDFCLACDRQTDGGVYCGEACRLAEYEKANSGSEASSPASTQGTSWSSAARQQPSNFYLAPAYNFSAYRTSSSPRASPTRQQSSPMVVSSKPVLTPSSSQSSLFSMQSTSSTSSVEPTHLSDEARRELRAYASSFDQSRYHRRQSQ